VIAIIPFKIAQELLELPKAPFIFALGIDVRVIEIDRHLEMRAKKGQRKTAAGPAAGMEQKPGFLSFGSASSSLRDF
jgi:hypothetical protein